MMGEAAGEEVRQLMDANSIPSNVADSTMTVWGHGDSIGFCGLLDADFCKLVALWKKKNPQLQTVELIACDSRHAESYLSGYASRVFKDMRAKGIGVNIKALPKSPWNTGRSTLRTERNTGTYCYMVARDDETYRFVDDRISALLPGLQGDLREVSVQLQAERGNRSFSLLYGHIRGLRGVLGVVSG
jgi:hypothetical protein